MSDHRKRLVKAEQSLSVAAVGEDWGMHWDTFVEMNESMGLSHDEAVALTIREVGPRDEWIATQQRKALERVQRAGL